MFKHKVEKSFHEICGPVSAKLRINYQYYTKQQESTSRLDKIEDIKFKEKEK